MYAVLLADAGRRPAALAALNRRGVNAVFHYVPLHSSPAGRRYGRAHGDLPHTVDVSSRLVRLPFWLGMTIADVSQVVGTLETVLVS
jgi:dTDP-4-amino-4,6-dideoxygalactose transaminase